MALHFAFPRAAASARGIGTAGLHSGIPHCRHRGAIGRLSVPVWLNGTSSPGRTAGRVPFLWAALRDAHPHRASPSNGGPHGAPEPGGSQGCCQGKKTTSAARGRQPNSRLPLGRPQPLALAALLTSRAPRRAPAVPTLHPFPPPLPTLCRALPHPGASVPQILPFQWNDLQWDEALGCSEPNACKTS